MFESIAAGIPPICTPHPQCVEIIRKFDCGIVLDDWSAESVFAGISGAHDIFGTARYHELVANCRKANRDELNWEHQFALLAPFLKPASEFTEGGPMTGQLGKNPRISDRQTSGTPSWQN
jgi:hypothetical protein